LNKAMREDILVIAIAGVDAGQQKSWRRPQGGAKWNTAPVIDRSGNRSITGRRRER
jgi:hypothetical protein